MFSNIFDFHDELEFRWLKTGSVAVLQFRKGNYRRPITKQEPGGAIALVGEPEWIGGEWKDIPTVDAADMNIACSKEDK